MRLALILLAACSAPAARQPIENKPVIAGPNVSLFAADGKKVRFYRATIDGVRETLALDTPSPIVAHAWAGGELVLRLEDHHVGIATPHGLELLPMPPASTWDWTPPPAAPGEMGLEKIDPRWELDVRGREIWLARCEWGEVTAFAFCNEWTVVRLRPPGAKEHKSGEYATLSPTRELVTPEPPIAPATSVNVRLVPDPDRPAQRNENYLEGPPAPRQKLACTKGGVTVEDPPAKSEVNDEYGHGGRTDLVWISTEPPVYQVGDWDGCYAGCPVMRTFEGCKPSERLGDQLVLGPSEVLALVGAQSATLFWRSHELGTIPMPTHFGFTP